MALVYRKPGFSSTEKVTVSYGGNIATLEGLKVLCDAGLSHVASEVITYVNKNHYYQTKIVTSLWNHPCSKEEYLITISHTGYWAEIGLRAALAFSQRQDLADFVASFARCYGLTCQIFDDMREIDDDLRNGYWSLPVSLAHANNWNLSINEGKALSIRESMVLAEDYIRQAMELCGSQFPSLLDLVERISKTGSHIHY
jgi:geranylgeranyl pyrophosphate synthase